MSFCLRKILDVRSKIVALEQTINFSRLLFSKHSHRSSGDFVGSC